MLSNATRTSTGVLDTDAGPNLVYPKVLPPGWEGQVKARKIPKITDGSRRPMTIRGVPPLHIQLRRMTVRTRFLVCPSVGGEAILWASFINRYVKAIYRESKRVAFHQEPSLAIERARPIPSARTPAGKFPKRKLSNKVRLAKAICHSPMTEVAATALCQSAGLVSLQNHPKLINEHLFLMANGVSDVIPDRPFAGTLSNFSEKPTRLRKGTVVGITMPAPVPIMEMRQVSPSHQATTSNNCEHGVNRGEEFESHREKVMELLREFSSMWSGQLEIGEIRHQ